ncbi:MAG TPA: hypothetical protein VN253_25590 [Kofleriaceae bacterium]|nr:hypothetical protein [Kofleriaceae bacterium]
MSHPYDPDQLFLFYDPIHDDVSRSTKHDHVHLAIRLESHAPPELGLELEEIQHGIELAIEETR